VSSPANNNSKYTPYRLLQLVYDYFYKFVLLAGVFTCQQQIHPLSITTVSL
jgi:hypothetical protein